MKKIKLKSPKLKSTLTFNKKIASRFMNMDYYKAQSAYQKKYVFIEAEKRRLSTTPWIVVTNLLDYYKNLGLEGYESPTGKTLFGIYKKNLESVKGRIIRNERLLNLVAKPELLLMAYKEIRGNKGALTPAAEKTKQDIKKLKPEQQEIYFKSNIFPDGFSIRDILLISKLIRKGLYPWGASSRIYIEKPGTKGKTRPITIPPFMDRIVQKAIGMILESIYEPVFEARNRSFGFRPNKGVHDAITAITSYKTNGMRIAIEGDIEAAYDTVDRRILLEILRKKIHDKKFINLIKERLDYEIVEKETKDRYKPNLGIPQGGIDSPYLFNIYMAELDEFVHTDVQEKIDKMNIGVYGSKKIENIHKRTFNKQFTKIKNALYTKKATLKTLKKKIKTSNQEGNTELLHELRKNLFNKIREIRLLRYKTRRTPSTDRTKVELRIFYIRYADDWILLTNGTKEVAEHIKNMISTFLETQLKVKLSANKTLITDITKEPAHFLGYEIRGQAMGPLRRYPSISINPKKTKQKWILSRASGLSLWTAPDKQRLINRLHMKGYCKANGFPIGIPMLSIVEPHVIVERYNAIIRGLTNYYVGFIRDISSIFRWIYILRYSCLKTLAQKYRTNISGIFKRFGHKLHNKSTSTISIQVILKIKNISYEKNWTLLTYKHIKKIIKKTYRGRKLEKRFWEIEKERKFGNYPIGKGRTPKITNDNFIDSISWVNLRTQSSFDMPCAICGTSENIEMHHIKHIRKRSYMLIPEDKSLEKVMALRNRKQVPICTYCHRNIVHSGKYRGPELRILTPTTRLVDNRIVHVESFIQKGTEYHSRTLEERGWTKRLQKK